MLKEKRHKIDDEFDLVCLMREMLFDVVCECVKITLKNVNDDLFKSTCKSKLTNYI